MKRSGFKKKSYAEVIEAKKKADARKRTSLRTKKTTKKKPKPKKKKEITSYKGIPSTKRWKGKGGWKSMFWTIFSMYTRKRDYEQYGRCVSCELEPEHWRKWDAGHYVSVTDGNFDTHFDEDNVHGQCKKCNNPKWTPDASIPFRRKLTERISAKKLDYLEDIRIGKKTSQFGEPSQEEYQRLCDVYLDKYNAL
jgi:hypothetical protein